GTADADAGLEHDALRVVAVGAHRSAAGPGSAILSVSGVAFHVPKGSPGPVGSAGSPPLDRSKVFRTGPFRNRMERSPGGCSLPPPVDRYKMFRIGVLGNRAPAPVDSTESRPHMPPRRGTR